MSAAPGDEVPCDTPSDVMAVIANDYPSSYLESEQVFTDDRDVTRYVMVFRADGVLTDFAVLFDGAPGTWCAVSSMEVPKPGAEA